MVTTEKKTFASRLKIDHSLDRKAIASWVYILGSQMLAGLQDEGLLRKGTYLLTTDLVEHRGDCEGQDPHDCIDFKLEVW